MKEAIINSFPENWEDADEDQLFSACCLSQQVIGKHLSDLAGFYRAMHKIHSEARKRRVAFPDLLTAAEKAALEFVTQNPLQN